MTDPVRLRDQPDKPYAADLARVAKARVVYDADKGLALLTAATTALPPATPATTASRLAVWKLGVLALGVVGTGAIIAIVASGMPPTAVHHGGVALPSAQPAASERVDVAPASPPVPEVVTDEAPVLPERAASPPAPPPARRPSTLASHPSSSGSAASASPAPSLAEETQNLATIRSTAASDPARALALVDDANARFTGGIFREEREAIAVGALSRLGRTAAARARAQKFLATYPKSALADRVRQDADLPRRNLNRGQ